MDAAPVSTEHESPALPPLPGAGEEPDPRFARWGVLRHKHFRIFWTAAFVSFLGDWFEFVGTQWLVAEKTKSPLWASMLGAAQLVPTLVLGLFGGVVADRVNRRKLLVVTQGIMMVIALAFAAVVHFNLATPWVLLGLSLAQGITIVFNNPAWQVMVPRLVPREDLTKAITLQGMSFNTARAIGPAIAGFIMAAADPSVLFFVNALSFIGVMFATFKSPDAPALISSKGLFDLKVIREDTRAAIRTVFTHKGIRAAMLATLVFASFATPVLRFLSLFVSEVYGRSEATFGVMTAIMGIGAVSGGFAMRLVPSWYPKHHFIPLSVMMGGLWIFLFSLEDNVYVACVFMYFVGLFWMWAFNSSMAALQMLVEDKERGRVLSVCNTVSLGLMPVGAFVATGIGEAGAALVKRHDPTWWNSGLSTQIGIATVSIFLVGAGIVMLIWRTPEVDGLTPGQAGHARRPGFIRGVLAWAHKPTPAGPRCPECNLPLGNAFLIDDTVLCPRCESRTPPSQLLNVPPAAAAPKRPEPELAAGK